MDKKDKRIKLILKIIGFITVFVGAGLISFGIIDFAKNIALDEFGTPKYFWFAFIGLPLLCVGIVCLIFAFKKPANHHLEDKENKK